MKIVTLIALVIAGCFPAISQIPDRAAQIEQLQTTLAALVGKGHRTRVMLRDLNEMEGSVVALTGNSFALRFKGMNGKKINAMIAYADVLALKSKDILLSFIPPETTSQYGSWDDVAEISYNNILDVVLDDGQKLTGRSGETKKDSLTLIDDQNNEKRVLPRDRILYLYRVRNSSRKGGDGVAGGANKGKDIGRDIGNTSSGKAFSSALGALIGAGVGALSDAAKQGKRFRVLIYSK